MPPSRRVAIVSVAGLLVSLLAGCGGDDDLASEERPAPFTIMAGAASPDAPPDVALFNFYPSSVSVHAGEVLRFENGSGGVSVPHTVTLGAGADIPARLPPPLAPGVGQVPAVWGRCVSSEPIDPKASDCPDGTKASYPPAGFVLKMPAFGGQAFYNSGIFDKGQAVEVPVGPDVEPGAYRFFCYLHPATMELSVKVVSGGRATQSQEELDRRAQDQIDGDLADGLAAQVAATGAARPAGTIQAGAEKGKAVVTRFFPSTVKVAAGETVTWVNEGFDPHVIALGKSVPAHDPQNFAPPTTAPGGDYTGGFAISGVFGSPPFPATAYAVRFSARGRYEFFCPIHPGMAGSVEVT